METPNQNLESVYFGGCLLDPQASCYIRKIREFPLRLSELRI